MQVSHLPPGALIPPIQNINRIVQTIPPPVIASGTLGAGLFAQPETPVEIQQFGAALPAPGHRQGQQQAQQKQS